MILSDDEVRRRQRVLRLVAIMIGISIVVSLITGSVVGVFEDSADWALVGSLSSGFVLALASGVTALLAHRRVGYSLPRQSPGEGR